MYKNCIVRLVPPDMYKSVETGEKSLSRLLLSQVGQEIHYQHPLTKAEFNVIKKAFRKWKEEK